MVTRLAAAKTLLSAPGTSKMTASACNMSLPGPSGLQKVPVVKRKPIEARPTIPLEVEDPFGDESFGNEISDENIENKENEIIFEGLVKVASPKSNKIPDNAKVFDLPNLKRQKTDGNMVAVKRGPLKNITNAPPAVYEDEILHDKILASNVFNDFYGNQSKLVHSSEPRTGATKS